MLINFASETRNWLCCYSVSPLYTDTKAFLFGTVFIKQIPHHQTIRRFNIQNNDTAVAAKTPTQAELSKLINLDSVKFNK